MILRCLFVALIFISCDANNINENYSPNTADSNTSKNWIQLGVCKIPNQPKSHGLMNCLVVKWQCPKCKAHRESLRWKICTNCCEKLNICKVCNKKIE